MTPWQPWTNVRPNTVKLLDLVEEKYALSRFMSRAFANVQDPRFPPRSRARFLLRILNVITRVIARPLVTKR